MLWSKDCTNRLSIIPYTAVGTFPQIQVQLLCVFANGGKLGMERYRSFGIPESSRATAIHVEPWDDVYRFVGRANFCKRRCQDSPHELTLGGV